MAFTLTITAGKDAGQAFEFDQPEVTIGRTAENDVVLYDAGVSRAHVKIRADGGGGCTVEDLGSSNGTLVNGERIEGEIPVSDGDEIKVGSVAFSIGIAGGGGDNSTRIVQVGAGRVPAARAPAVSPRAPKPAGVPARRPAGDAAFEATGGGDSPRGAISPRAPRGAAKAIAPAKGAPAAPASARARARRQEADSSGTKRVLDWFQGLSTPKKVMLGSGGGVFSLLVVAFVAKLAIGGDVGLTGGFGASTGPFPISEKTPQDVYGVGPDVTISTPDKAIFEWKFVETQAGLTMITVSYSSAHVMKEDMVEIRLNGYPIGYAAQALGDWQMGNTVQLPKKYLRPNEVNQLVFDNIKNPPGEEQWELGEVKLLVDQLPVCEPVDCIAEAKKLYDLGRRDYENRAVGAANLYNSWLNFKRARLYLEPVDPKPDLYDMVMQMIKDSSAELSQICSKMRFTGIKLYLSGDRGGAEKAFENVLLFFPGPEHWCYRQTKVQLDQMKE